jgi:hypothetical protein
VLRSVIPIKVAISFAVRFIGNSSALVTDVESWMEGPPAGCFGGLAGVPTPAGPRSNSPDQWACPIKDLTGEAQVVGDSLGSLETCHLSTRDNGVKRPGDNAGIRSDRAKQYSEYLLLVRHVLFGHEKTYERHLRA